MPAKIVILSGAEQGADLWIEEEVQRLGQDPLCALRVADPGVPGHAATVEYRDGGYLLHNRCDEELLLDGKPLLPRGQRSWVANKDLTLPGGVVLKLVVESDPRPAKRQTAPPQAYEYPVVPPEEAKPGGLNQDDDDAPVSVPSSDRSKKITQFVVILLCALVGVYMLFLDKPSEKTEGELSPRQQFDQAVAALVKQGDDAQARHLRVLLQDARIAELRGDQAQAQIFFGAIRDRLLVLRGAEGGGLSADYQKVWDFVKTHLKPIEVED